MAFATTNLASRAARALLRFLWLVLIPALLAGVISRYLVPHGGDPQGSGLLNATVRTATAHPVELAVVLFVVIAALANYWRFYLPGGRFLARLPLELAASSPPHVLAELEAVAKARPQRRARQAFQLALFVASMAVALAGAYLLRANWLLYRVLSSSMLPTFQVNDLLVGSRSPQSFAAPPLVPAKLPALHRGDIVVFRDTTNAGPEYLIKRVIGLPGDEIIMNSGRPYINRWPVPKCDAGRYANVVPGGGYITGRLVVEFLDGASYLTVHAPMRKQWRPYVVQPGEVFVLGDNRNASVDSRMWQDHGGSGVPLDQIVARVDRSLVHSSRDGKAAWSTLLAPARQLSLNLDGLDSALLDQGIQQCLAKRPQESSPPKLDLSIPQPTGYPASAGLSIQ